MSEPYVAEIRMFAGSFAPRGWALCDGQLLAVSQNDALFSLVGTIYGGDGRTTFGLPDMRGRIPVHMGTGPGLTPRTLGQMGGAEKVTLNANQLAAHSHTFHADTSAAGSTSALGNFMATSTASSIYGSATPSATLRSDAISVSEGGGGSHENMMPSLCVNFIIALFGVYPSRN